MVNLGLDSKVCEIGVKSEWKGELYKRSITGEAMSQNDNVIFSAATHFFISKNK